MLAPKSNNILNNFEHRPWYRIIGGQCHHLRRPCPSLCFSSSSNFLLESTSIGLISISALRFSIHTGPITVFALGFVDSGPYFLFSISEQLRVCMARASATQASTEMAASCMGSPPIPLPLAPWRSWFVWPPAAELVYVHWANWV